MNGKKTWIGLVMIGVGHAVQAAGSLAPDYAPLLTNAGSWLVNLGTALATVGAAHKLAKGE